MKINKLLIIGISCMLITTSYTNHSVSKKNHSDHHESVEENTENSIVNAQQRKIIYSKGKESLKAYYELPHIKEFYRWQRLSYSTPPDLIYPDDLSSLSYGELRLLRNEIFARNGYLFNDGFLRGYFNRFKWYMPIFNARDFKVSLNSEEQSLVNEVLKEEEKRKENKIISKGGLELYNTDLIANSKQFTSIPEEVKLDFSKQNFSIVSANRSMPFYVYDKNAYQYIPHYITTDLYLFILHKYFSRFLEKLDENFMYNQLFSLLQGTSNKINDFTISNPSNQISEAIEWAQMYSALALYSIGDSLVTPPEKYKSDFYEEIKNIDALFGNPSFIDNKFVDYKELKPRGHYTKSEKLKKYFRGFKWISLNGINLNKEEELKGMIVFAHIIKYDDKLFDSYKKFVSVVEKLAGQEDNISLSDIINTLSTENLEEAISATNLKLVKDQLNSLNKERVKKVFGESFQTDEREIKRIYFLSSTYSIGAEIFSKLVHIDWLNSKRPFPKGLDIPAVFGDSTAQNILIKEYKENDSWEDYLPRLKKLQNQFKDFNEWNHNYGFKGLQTALSSFSEADNYPDFMKTDAYNRKELSTSLASWTHIKHDLILYQEKSFAAEMGMEEGPEPPLHLSYVEPNLKFWDSAIDLVKWLKELSSFEPRYNNELKKIERLGLKLRTVAYKQVEGKEITREEYDQLHYVGGTIEYILFGLLETNHLPARDRSMALIADVYVYNEVNLNVAVGHADDIYTIVPIKDEYYIARGAVFSYYEFTGKIYNDEEWKALIENKNIPDRPEWIKPIVKDVTPLEGQMQFRYPGHGIHY